VSTESAPLLTLQRNKGRSFSLINKTTACYNVWTQSSA